MISASTRRIALGRAWLRAVAWALGFAWTGCATTPLRVAPGASGKAQLAVTNLTDYTWSVAVRSAPDGEAKTWRVPPREVVEVELTGGDYVIEQTIVAANVPLVAATRRFEARLLADERYQWSLATLRSLEPSESAAPPPNVAR